jgi:1-acyl-sn-glycerol-3-phosphate acyltransferase
VAARRTPTGSVGQEAAERARRKPIPAEKKAMIAGAAADLDARDPDFIRSQLPLTWLLATLYFRAEVRGLERVPEDRPVLFVGNHSGGNMTPDSMVFMLAFATYFDAERPIYALAHSLVTSWPLIGTVGKKWGIITAGHEAATVALESGGCVLVYPGGDIETHRPWTARHEIRFADRKGFLKLARDAGVPVVPVVSCGGQQTFLPLTDGAKLARALRLDKVARLKVLPVSLSLPWGINVGDFVGHLPLPVKIRQEVLSPIDVTRFDDDDRAYDYVTTVMQETLTALAAERVLPVL